MDNESFLCVFWHMQLYMSWYIRSFFGFTFLNIIYFFNYSCTNIFHRRSLYTFYCDRTLSWFHQQWKHGWVSPERWSVRSYCMIFSPGNPFIPLRVRFQCDGTQYPASDSHLRAPLLFLWLLRWDVCWYLHEMGQMPIPPCGRGLLLRVYDAERAFTFVWPIIAWTRITPLWSTLAQMNNAARCWCWYHATQIGLRQ